ncbi:DUF4244 domain-containing protein [Dactylosporangium sp. NPDC049140]|jgi:Flp pilus assembly pilin Flp|uniref:DUF4244 domain-containing protein n=1 Tax=unclassified Dactylosporangium TaxID=2621675 RepID=UPI0033F54F26
MQVTRARLLAVVRRDDGAISIEYAALVVIGIILVGVLISIVHSDVMKAYLTGLMMKDPA